MQMSSPVSKPFSVQELVKRQEASVWLLDNTTRSLLQKWMTHVKCKLSDWHIKVAFRTWKKHLKSESDADQALDHSRLWYFKLRITRFLRHILREWHQSVTSINTYRLWEGRIKLHVKRARAIKALQKWKSAMTCSCAQKQDHSRREDALLMMKAVGTWRAATREKRVMASVKDSAHHRFSCAFVRSLFTAWHSHNRQVDYITGNSSQVASLLKELIIIIYFFKVQAFSRCCELGQLYSPLCVTLPAAPVSLLGKSLQRMSRITGVSPLQFGGGICTL